MRGPQERTRADEFHGRETVKQSTRAAQEEFTGELEAKAELADADLRDPSLYINRELSMLDFFERVLAEARDTQQPSPGAGQVRRHRRLDPRRVLHGARRRPAAAGRGRRLGGVRRRVHAAAAAAHRAGARLGHHEGGAPVFQRAQARARGRRHPHRRPRRPRRRAARRAAALLRGQGLPGTHAAGVRPGPPLPAHLQHEPQPRGTAAGRQRRRALRARQGAGFAAAPRARRPAGEAGRPRTAGSSSGSPGSSSSSPPTSPRCSPAWRCWSRTRSA